MQLVTPVRGFTILELMMTVAVAAILASVAIPSFQSFVNKTQLQSTAADVASVFQNAREKAVSEDAEVTIVQDVDSVDCSFTGDLGSETCLGYQVVSSEVTLASDHSFKFQPTGRLDINNSSVTVSVSHSDVTSHRFEISILSSGRVSVREIEI